MKKTKILLLILMTFIFNTTNVLALEQESGWTVYEKGSITIPIDKLVEFNEKLSYRVSELNKLNLDKIYRFRIESNSNEELEDYQEITNELVFNTKEEALEWASSNNIELEGWSLVENSIKSYEEERTLQTTKYETIEEANDAIVEFKNATDEAETTINEIRDESGDITERQENNSKFNTFEGATNAALALKDDNHDYLITAEVITNDPEYVRTDVININIIFDTTKEIEDYVLELETLGYIVNIEINEVYENSTLNKEFEEKIDAENAIVEFIASYPEAVISNITEVRDENGDITITINNDYKFDNYEDASDMAETLKEDTKYYVVEVTINKEEPEYVETITTNINLAFETKEEAESYIETLENNNYLVNATIKEVNELSTLDKVYETMEEAETALEEFLSNYSDTTISNITEVRDETGDTTENIENTYKFDTLKDAEDTANGLRNDNHDYLTEVTVYQGEQELDRTETLTLNILFDTIEEANSYIKELENNGYIVEATTTEVKEISTLNQTYDTLEDAEEALNKFISENQNITSSNIEDVRDNSEDIITNTPGTEEYLTRTEAEEVASSITTTGSDYKVTANIREESKNTIIGPTNIESEQFNTREEAVAYIDSLKSQGYDVSNLEIELVPFEESIWGDQDNVVVDPGTGNNTSFTYGHFDVTLLTEFTKIDANGNKTTVKGVVRITNVKINNKNVTMEGPSVDRNTGLTEYTSEERNRLNVTNNSLVEVTGTVAYYTNESNKILSSALPFTIEGYLTESQNVCGGTLGRDKGFDLEFESITIVNNKVIVDSNVVNKYKVKGTVTKTESTPVYYVDTTTTTYGYDYQVNAEGYNVTGYSVTGLATKDIYKDVYLLNIKKTTKDYDYKTYAEGIKFIEYLLTGTKSIDIYKDVYTLDITKTTKDYDYIANAEGKKLTGYNATGVATKDIYQDVYTLDVNKITKDYDYEVSGNGIKTLYEVISKYVRLTDVNYIIEYMEIGKGGDVEELPPQTGINENNTLYSIIASLMLMVFLFIKKLI